MASEEFQLQPLDMASLRDRIEQEILNAILKGTFEPGERLIESAIAGQLGVSRAPVREALSALEREGVIVNVPRRGYFVADFTDQDIEEIYSLRLLLELDALRRAIDRFTEQDLQEMQQIVDELGEATQDTSDPGAVITLDLSFHELICRRADHSRLYSAWNSIRLQTYLLIGLTSRTHIDPAQPKELHQRILDAISENDLERAEADLNIHILDAKRRARSALEAWRSWESARTSHRRSASSAL